MDISGTTGHYTRRKNYFVDKKFQGSFILKFCLLVVAAGALMMAALYLLAGKAATVSFVDSRVVVQSTADFLFPILMQTLIVATVIVGVTTVFFTLFVSHRIAGPAHRFKKILSSLSEGDFTGECRIRRGDSLQDVASALNEMMASVRRNLKALDDDLAGLKRAVEVMQGKSGTDDPELNELKKAVSELDSSLHRFKI